MRRWKHGVIGWQDLCGSWCRVYLAGDLWETRKRELRDFNYTLNRLFLLFTSFHNAEENAICICVSIDWIIGRERREKINEFYEWILRFREFLCFVGEIQKFIYKPFPSERKSTINISSLPPIVPQARYQYINFQFQSNHVKYLVVTSHSSGINCHQSAGN